MIDLDRQTALSLRAWGTTDVGRRRACNEDRIHVDAGRGLFVVADGAGGHAAGDLAAERAIAAIVAHVAEVDPSELDAPGSASFGMPRAARVLASAIQRANDDVRKLAASIQSERGVGTTVVAALWSPRTSFLHVAHVGDSRCYRLRGGQLEQLTQDHSLITDVLEERPDISDEVLGRLPKHVVTRALGMADRVRVSVRSYALVAGDRYLLCTDGLSGPIPAQRITRVLRDRAEPRDSVDALIELANAAGGPDNVSAVVISCEAGPDDLPAIELEPESTFHPGVSSDPELLILGIEDLDLAQHLYSDSEGLLQQLEPWANRKKPA